MDSSTHLNQKFIATALLIATTVLWGSTFIITKTMIQEVPIFLYLSLRYFIALIGFIPFLIRIKGLNKRIIWMGFFSGILYYLAITFQTYGLVTTSASKAGFITGLSTIMVPFFTWFFFKEKVINKKIWFAAILSVIGMGFLLLEGIEGVIIGDVLVLICAVFCALFIIYNDKCVRLVDVYLYTIIQLITLCLLCISSSLILNESYNLEHADLNFWLIMFYMGFMATSLTFLFTNWGQQHQESSQTAIIFALEPVFAVIFASFLIGNEVLSWQTWFGCGLIFLALIIVVRNKDVIE
ncbi:MAG: DMT family transporter [Promethearchaeota archaeon]|nr:MAG: DMT family transporter [Candidatus Lokiarchaeota archaeon]